jgi:PAS domain S-box-containing protein
MNRILIVDDKEENLYYLQALFAGHGWEVVTARHGAEALVKARQKPPQITVSDLLMPVMDGYTLLCHWKADASLKKIPFVVYTATYTEASDEELAVNLGADAFILKPCEPDDFLRRLEEVAESVRQQGPAQPRGSTLEDRSLHQGYSETLIRKLEEKTLQLGEANRALREEIAESETARRDNKKLNDELTERVKELRLLYDVSRLLRDTEMPLAEVAGQIVDMLPQAMQRSAGVAVRVRLGAVEAASAGFRPATWSLLAEFVTSDGAENQIEVVWTDEDDTGAEPFMKEEHDMLDSVAEMLRVYLDQRLLTWHLEIERTRLVTAQKVANMGSWATDLATFAISWSEQTHLIFETDPRAFQPTHQRFLELVHPEDRDAVDAAFTRSISLKEPQEFEHRILVPGGRVKHVIERWQVFFDADGTPSVAIGTTQDVTERVQAELELKRTSNLLSAVADGLPDPVFVKDLEGRYLLLNKGAASFVGKPVEEVLGRDDTALFGPEDARLVMDNDHEVIVSGKAITTEEVLTAAGVTRTYLATKAPYRDDQGRVIGVIGISSDITQRKLAEQKLREQATLLDKAQEAILVRDLDHRILYWNKSAERLYGWKAEEVLGQSIRELLYKDPASFSAATQAALERGEWVGEIQQYNREGRPLTIEGHWTLVRDEQGRPQSILAINTDITERRRLEQQVLRAQRLDSIGTLAGGIAHDLNNVLAPILMSVELLRSQEKDPRRQDILATMEASARRGADMVRQVLSFARGVEGSHAPVQTDQLLADLEKIANETFLKTIRVVRGVPDDLWNVMGDATQLHQVLLNLCVNARDAMPGGGTLTLSAANTWVDEAAAARMVGLRPGPYVHIQVQDTGTGMSPEVQERIFEPFFTTKEVGKGTGLGLSTSLAIVQSHGGFLRVESDPGSGSVFHVHLPAHAVSEPHEASSEQDLPRGNGETILLVDDESSIRRTTGQALETFGYRVLTAADGAEALAVYAARGGEIDIVLTDMMMPLMDGASMIQALRRMNAGVRIIASSGLNVAGMVTRAAEAGVHTFLAKPYTTESLLKTLHQALHG